jgi:hypothetical protein
VQPPRQKARILLRGQPPDVADEEHALGDSQDRAKALAAAPGEVLETDPRGNHMDRHLYSAPTQDRGHGLARREHRIAQVAVVGRQLDREAPHRLGVTRHIVGVVLVQSVVCEHERHVQHPGQPHGRCTQQERVVRMDDVGSEGLNGGAAPARCDQHDREVAAVETLDCGDANDVRLTLRRVLELGADHQHLIAPASILGGERLHRPRYAAGVGSVGVGHHDDFHAPPHLSVAPCSRKLIEGGHAASLERGHEGQAANR